MILAAVLGMMLFGTVIASEDKATIKILGGLGWVTVVVLTAYIATVL